MTPSTSAFSAATATGVGQLGLEGSQELPGLIYQQPEALAGQQQPSSLPRCRGIAAQPALAQLAGPQQPTSTPTPQLLQLGLPTSTEGLIKDRKTSKELKELSLFSLSKVYINIFIGNRSLTSIFQWSKR